MHFKPCRLMPKYVQHAVVCYMDYSRHSALGLMFAEFGGGGAGSVPLTVTGQEKNVVKAVGATSSEVVAVMV